MRRDIFLPALALAGGIGGFFLRRWQLASAYLAEEGLFVHGAPATWALLGLTALLALAFALLVQGGKEAPEDFLPAFGSCGAGQMAAFAAAFALTILAAQDGLREGFLELRLWRAAPELYQAPVTRLLASGLCVLGGFGMLHLGRMAYRSELNDGACRLAALPALAGVVWLFTSHLETGTEPVLMKYGFGLAAICLLTLAHYDIAGFLFGRPHRRRAPFLALTGTVLGMVSLADRPGLFTAAALAAYILSALAFTGALLRAEFGPPPPKRLRSGRMPPPEEEEQDE